MLTYFCCPAHVVTLLQGNPTAFYILSVLILHRNTTTNNTYFMSVPDLSKIVGISRRETYYSIDELKELGLIEELANRRGERMFHLPFLMPKAENMDETEEADTDSLTLGYQVDPKLQAQWDAIYGSNGGTENGNG